MYLRVQPFIVLRLYEGIHVGPNKKMALRIRRYDRKYEGTFEDNFVRITSVRKYFRKYIAALCLSATTLLGPRTSRRG